MGPACARVRGGGRYRKGGPGPGPGREGVNAEMSKAGAHLQELSLGLGGEKQGGRLLPSLNFGADCDRNLP